MNKIILVILLVFVSGCSAQSTRVTISSEQQTFLVECPETLPYDYGLEGKWWLLMAKEWSAMYHECMTRHNGHVKFILNQNQVLDGNLDCLLPTVLD